MRMVLSGPWGPQKHRRAGRSGPRGGSGSVTELAQVEREAVLVAGQRLEYAPIGLLGQGVRNAVHECALRHRVTHIRLPGPKPADGAVAEREQDDAVMPAAE